MNSWNWSELAPLLPELFMAVAGMVLLIAGAFRGNAGTRFICQATVFVFAITALLVLQRPWEESVITLNGMFVFDGFAGLTKLFILMGLAAALTLSIKYLYEEGMPRFEYPILILFAGLGMMIMVSAHDLLALYIGMELQSLSLYVLAAIRRDSLRSAEAGIKYFVLGALSSGMILFGISLIYGYAGTTNYTLLAETFATQDGSTIFAGAVVGMAFMLAGLVFKISAVPFHMWTPDVYEGAPTSVTALFAMVPKFAAMALIIRLLFVPFGPLQSEWLQIIVFVSVASMIWAAFAAIVQSNIKRLLAYSSIGHMGYALIGVIAGTPGGLSAVLVYMVIYMIMTAGVFGIVLYMRRSGIEAESIRDLAGLSRTAPVMAYAMAVLMFSMSGVPPMAGFFGKFLIFQAAVAEGYYILAVIGVLTSVVAAYYYLRVIKVMFFDEPADRFDWGHSAGRQFVVFASVAFILGFILYPMPLIDAASQAVLPLFAAG